MKIKIYSHKMVEFVQVKDYNVFRSYRKGVKRLC